MEQPVLVKCHLCGGAAKHAFAYALFSEREEYLGVIYRGICKDCLNQYIDRIKSAKRGRAEGLLWLAMFLPIGLLLFIFAKGAALKSVGFGLIVLGVVLPIASRVQQRLEARRARGASDAQNEAKYSGQVCREDARRTNGRAKLIPLRAEYGEEDFDAPRISKEFGITLATAEQVKLIAPNVLAGMRTASAPPVLTGRN